MPYIADELRQGLSPDLSNIELATASGELNFQITTVIMEYLKTNGMTYRTLNDIIGALEGAKLEFYRRVVVPYEDFKCDANGDVYQ